MKKPPVIGSEVAKEFLQTPVFNRSGNRLVADGLFTWQSSGIWLLPIRIYRSFSIGDVTWKIISKDAAVSGASTYHAVSERGERIAISCPEYREPWAMVSYGKEPWMIDRPGNEAILKNSQGVEFARVTPAWKDADEEAGIWCLIKYRADTPIVLVALTLGLHIGSFGTLHYY